MRCVGPGTRCSSRVGIVRAIVAFVRAVGERLRSRLVVLEDASARRRAASADVRHGLVRAELVEKFLQPLMCCGKVIISCALRANVHARVKRLVVVRVGAVEARAATCDMRFFMQW